MSEPPAIPSLQREADASHLNMLSIFHFVVAGIDCVQIPFGTILGGLTILVLSRDSVRELYSP